MVASFETTCIEDIRLCAAGHMWQQPACSFAGSRPSLADPSLPGSPYSTSVVNLAWHPRPASNYRAHSSVAHHASVGCRCGASHPELPFFACHSHLAHGRNEHGHCQPLPCMAGVCALQ